MYACTESKRHPDLAEYADNTFANSVSLVKRGRRTCYRVRGNDDTYMDYAGLNSNLARCYFPHFKAPRRRHAKGTAKPKRQASKTTLGTRVDQEILLIVAGRKKKFHPMTKHLVDYFKERGHTLQAAQLPVRVARYNCVTQADCITVDSENRLWMWEVKTGGVGINVTRGKGMFSAPLSDIKVSLYGTWELQRYWTQRALRESGIPIHKSHVLNVYYDTKKDAFIVNALPNAPWTTRLDVL